MNVDDWWSCIETNVRGCFLIAHTTLPHLVTTKGYIILLSSTVSQLCMATTSAYNNAKHATNRLAKWIDIDSWTKPLDFEYTVLLLTNWSR